MALTIDDFGALSAVVSEYTYTTGIGPYTPAGAVARSGRFGDFFSPGDLVDYTADDGGSLVEHGQGTFQSDGTITRDTIFWTSLGAFDGIPINWRPGRRYLRCRFHHGGGGTSTQPDFITGFWNGVVPDGSRVQRYLFVQPEYLPVNLPLSRAVCDVPVPAGGTFNQFVDQSGNVFVNEIGSVFVDSAGSGPGTPAVFTLTKNGAPIGSMTFPVESASAVFDFENNINFVPGDVLNIVAPTPGDPTLADLVWTIVPLSGAAISGNQWQIRARLVGAGALRADVRTINQQGAVAFTGVGTIRANADVPTLINTFVDQSGNIFVDQLGNIFTA